MDKYFKCEGLNKVLNGFRLDNINFEVEPGMILGIIGVNGCGKTSLIRTLLGSYRLDQCPEDSGEIWLDDLHFMKDQKAFRKRLAFVLQDLPFWTNTHAREVGEFYAPFYDGFDLEKYFELLDEYKVPTSGFISELSMGQKLRLQIAFAKSYDADLYILDEPVGNLDPDFRELFYEMIRELTYDEKKAVIMSSHLVTELENIADKLLWISKKDQTGYVRFFGTIDELRESYRILEDDPNLLEQLQGECSDMIVGSSIRESHKEVMLTIPVKDITKNDTKNNTYSLSNEFERRLGHELYSACRYADLQEIMYYVEKYGA